MTDPNAGSTWTPRVDESDSVQFGHPNLSAGLTDHQMNWGGVAALDALISFVAAHPGSVTWVSGGLSEAAVGSNVQIDVFKNGVEMVESILILAGADAGRVYYPIGAYTFVAGDKLDLRVTTGAGWTSTTADLGACLGFSYAGV